MKDDAQPTDSLPIAEIVDTDESGRGITPDDHEAPLKKQRAQCTCSAPSLDHNSHEAPLKKQSAQYEWLKQELGYWRLHKAIHAEEKANRLVGRALCNLSLCLQYAEARQDELTESMAATGSTEMLYDVMELCAFLRAVTVALRDSEHSAEKVAALFRAPVEATLLKSLYALFPARVEPDAEEVVQELIAEFLVAFQEVFFQLGFHVVMLLGDSDTTTVIDNIRTAGNAAAQYGGIV